MVFGAGLPAESRTLPTALKYPLAIFDFDGTLADTLGWMRGLYAQFGHQFGLKELSPAEEERIRDLHGRELLRALGLPLWKVPRLMREMRARMAAETGRFKLFPGIAQSLQRLAEGGIRLGIVSSNSKENVQRILGAELGSLIHHYDCGASMFGKTPKVRRVIRLSRAAGGIYIGDEVRDAEASREAGLSFGAVTWGHHRLEILQAYRPDEIFHLPSDISDRLLG